MGEITREQRMALDIIAASLDCQYTEQQKEFASDFTVPTMSFSDPGSGKTHTAIAGLIMAQTFHGIPGKKINAMSFTNAATDQLAARYKKAARQCNVPASIQFTTFHKTCRQIVASEYPDMKIRAGNVWDTEVPRLQVFMQAEGLETDDLRYVRKVLDAINTVNSSLQFDNQNLSLAYCFRALDMDIELFQRLRKRWFFQWLLSRNITQGDIPIYALYVLLSKPELCSKYKSKYRIMLVDEFQDMSLLHLAILNLISTALVVIGDMKQQIFAFNGASQQIVEEYMKMYPNARSCPLTKSFRCKNEIADYATALIKANDPNVVPFEGCSDGGVIKVTPFKDVNLEGIIRSIKEEQSKVGLTKWRDSMFLFRNNFSATPIAEELYKQGVDFQMGKTSRGETKFSKVMDITIFRELCMYADLSEDPNSEANWAHIPKLFPEFKQFNSWNCPIVEAMRRSHKGLLDVNYWFTEDSSYEIIDAMKKARTMILAEKGSNMVLNVFLNIYEKYIIEGKWWVLDREKEFYFDLVAPVLLGKTYPVMRAQEYDKEKKIRDCTQVGMGVRCYTVHSAKGLEAEDVFIIDCERDIFPTGAAMKRYERADCAFEAAKEIRNERNLLYVAATRAKDNVYIFFKDELSPLVASPLENEYSIYDAVYNGTRKEFDDIGAFKRVFNFDKDVNE